MDVLNSDSAVLTGQQPKRRDSTKSPSGVIQGPVGKVKWPKTPPPISEEQIKLQQEFLKIWHELLPARYGLIEKFNHNSAILRNSLNNKPNCKTLEIGAGLGEHINYEDLSRQEYTALEIRSDFLETIKQRFPTVHTVKGDIQGYTGLPNGYFDRIIGVHVLEHLRDLPSALHEIRRLLKPNGEFVAIIPCEGGLAYSLARRISAQRIFEKTFKVPYKPIIKNEHVSEAWEILHELPKYFTVSKRSYWPLKVPIISTNLVIALSLRPKF